MDLKLVYGIRDGRLRYIDDVERGLKCGCVCPSCEHPLVARRGPVKVPHFAHYQDGDCGKGIETALHLMAKEILEDRKEIVLPGAEPSDPSKLYTIGKVVLETRLGDIVPDVTAYIEGRPILIEVAVTHDIDEPKRRKIRELGVSTLVIDLSNQARTISRDELAQIVVEGTEKKRWEFNRVAAKKKLRDWETKRRFQIVQRGDNRFHVDGCPKQEAWKYRGKPYANVMRDCYKCEFLVLDSGRDVNEFTLSYPPTPHGYILCGWSGLTEVVE